MKSQVSIVKCATYQQEALYLKVKEAVDLIGGITAFIRPNSKVLVKPNLLIPVSPDNNITTHPEFVRAAIRLLKEINCRVYIGDGPSVFGGHSQETSGVYEATGMKEVAEQTGVELVAFDKSFFPERKNPSSAVFPLTTQVKECDFIINLPKLKTHELMVLTAAVKNLFGLIPGTFKMELHKNFFEPEKFADMLLDIYLAASPALTIIDAISGIEGNGPATSGVKRDFGLILAGKDAVSMDCVLADLIKVDPEIIFTNKQARIRNIGNTDLRNIEIKGEEITGCRIDNFKLPEASMAQLIKNKLPKPVLNILKSLLYLRPRIDSDICRLCESCIKNCPQKTIFKKKGKIVIDYSNCISCFCCREVCPDAAVKMEKGLLTKILGM